MTACASSRDTGPRLMSADLARAAYSASGVYESHGPAMAFDGDTTAGNSYWNSGGFSVQWIEIDLQQPVKLAGIHLIVSQSPPGPTIHEVWVSDNPIQADLTGVRRIHQFKGVTKDGDVLQVPLTDGTTGRYVQVRTLESPSWVAWREIEVRGE